MAQIKVRNGRITHVVTISDEVVAEVEQLYKAKDYAKLSNYARDLARGNGRIHDVQYARAAIDVRRGGIWYTAEENAAAKRAEQEAQCWAMREAQQAAPQQVVEEEASARDMVEAYLEQEADLEAFWAKLENHDWLYEMSDCGRTWERGREQHKALEREAAECEIKTAMFQDYKKYEWSCVNGSRLAKPSVEAYLP